LKPETRRDDGRELVERTMPNIECPKGERE